MFMDRLLVEVQRLADLFSLLDMVRRAGLAESLLSGQSPRTVLRIAAACLRISELGESIAKAGHRECEKSVLDEIMREARHVLYNVEAGFSRRA